ncbi:MAG TPA: UDP-N-acetylmuramoyl-L-alanyl-D-glutamate--2,6-diaminopimelate ligase [Firmicutes bacterium]|nr:UDP-N-acetylmuramoyl-L-alanyl-D-glutamate--2,6-diaminopimelate ligase [Bacillota bacterium]
MDLNHLSHLIGYELLGENLEIKNIVYDSREVVVGSVFFAISGVEVDGHLFIEDAFKKGAIAVVGEKNYNGAGEYFRVPSSKKALAVVASHYYQKPSKDLNLVGVIGTNGKTTITYLIQHVFECLGIDTGLIGTNGSWVGQKIQASHTTPMSPDLNELLLEGVKHNLNYMVMEVSSHGIKENRVDQIEFDRLIFTNITEEHLDYHKTFDDYLFTKMRPFIQFNDYDLDKTAIINLDDEHSGYFINVCNGKVLTYSCNTTADICAKDIVYKLESSEFKLYVKNKYITNVEIPLFGKYNIYNVLSVIGYFYSLGYDPKLISKHLENMPIVEGRFEYYKTQNNITIVIDYAHNPDAIFQVLTCLNTIAKGNIITVLGAGGNRDKTKRKVMGKHSTYLSDHVIFTSDNPRNEDPLAIIYEMLTGASHQNYTIVVDRDKAIEAAIEMAKPKDIVVVLGKGHEKTQNINGKIVPFSDKIVVEEVIRKRGI